MISEKNGKNDLAKNSVNFFRLRKWDIPFLRNRQFHLWLLAIAFSFLSASFILPRVYQLTPNYAVGSIAKQNIKASHGFLVEEKEATEKKRVEALKRARPVFDYHERTSEEIGLKLSQAFLLLKGLTGNKKKDLSGDFPLGHDKVRRAFEDSLNISLSPDQFLLLTKNQDLENLPEKLKVLLNAVYQANYVTDIPRPTPAGEYKIIVRNPQTALEEETDNLTRPISSPEKARTILRDPKLGGHLGKEPREIRELIINLAALVIKPNLTFNQAATEAYRQRLLAEVQPVYFQVQKNEMLVREGQKITPYELLKLEAYYHKKGEGRIINISRFIGVFLAVLLLSLILYQVATRWLKPAIDLRGLFFLTAVALVQMVIIKVGIFLAQAVNQTFPSITLDIFYFSIPFGVGAMLVIILMNHSTAIIYAIFAAFLVGFFFEGDMAMALYCFAGSMAVTSYIRNCRRRSDFFRAGLYLGAVNGVTVIILSVMTGEFTLMGVFLKLVMGIAGGIVAGFIVAGITPIFEALFDFITEIRLLELANLNNPLFQRMVIEAPGTYHHSIVVASLVEGAAESIKANPLLAKVSAYYHDIGKLKKPHYFIENQINGENRHDRLSTKMSSLVIISHVKDGCEFAAEMKLGSRIRDIIRQHHGNSLVGFFWEKARNESVLPNCSLSESDFRYPGPKPQTREAGLVLLGDVIEASSRALKNPTPARINNLVRERIEKIFLDGQLDECEITLRDLNIIAESFIKILNGIFHHRIDYPEPTHRELSPGKKENNGHPDRKQAEKTKARPASNPELPG